MKTNRKQKLTITSLTALALCVAPLAIRAQDKPADKPADKSYSSPSSSATPAATADTKATDTTSSSATTTSDFAIKVPSISQTGATLRAAAKDVEKQSARKLTGHHVRGSDAKDLGKINDFLVDTHSGEVAFAIVSSGGIAGAGDKLRLVNFTALKPGAKNDEFTVGLDHAAWEQIPVVKEDEFKNGQFTMTAEQRNQQAARFNGGSAAVGAPSAVAADASASLVRASDLAGRSLHSGSQDIGNIEVVIIDRDTASATALLDPKKGFANTSQKFLVPFSQLQITGTKREPITTTLTRAEFDNVTTATTTTATATDKVSATTTTPATDTLTTSTPSEVPTSPAAVAATTELNRDLTASTATPAQPADTIRADASVETSKSTTAKDTVASDSSASKSADIAVSTSSTESIKTEAMKDKVATTDSAIANSTPDASASTSATATVAANSEQPKTGVSSTDKSDTTAKSDSSTSSSTSTVATNSEQPKTDVSSAEKSDAIAKSDTSASASPSSTASIQSPTTDQTLTPTGKTSADTVPAGTDAALATAAQSIRKSFDDDAALSKLDIRITPENGKLVLRGSVKDAMVKSTIELKAREKADGRQIDNQITVSSK